VQEEEKENMGKQSQKKENWKNLTAASAKLWR